MCTERPANCESLRMLVGAVIHRHAGRWLRFILSILKNEADAEDVIQDAVRRVLIRDISFCSEDEARRYLGRAIANAALELFNRRKRERRRESSINEHSLPALNTASPFLSMVETEKAGERERLLSLLDEGLKKLPVKQYEALRLTILESGGLSIRDVGAVNGIAYSTLRHRSKQGLKHLRSFLEKSRNQKSGVRRQESGVRSQESGVRIDESGTFEGKDFSGSDRVAQSPSIRSRSI